MARCYPCRQVRAIHGRVGHTRRLVEARSIIRSEWFETDIGRGEDKIFGPNVSQLEYDNQKCSAYPWLLRGRHGSGRRYRGQPPIRRCLVEMTEAEALALIASWDAPTEPPPVTMPGLWNRFRAVQKSELSRG